MLCCDTGSGYGKDGNLDDLKRRLTLSDDEVVEDSESIRLLSDRPERTKRRKLRKQEHDGNGLVAEAILKREEVRNFSLRWDTKARLAFSLPLVRPTHSATLTASTSLGLTFLMLVGASQRWSTSKAIIFVAILPHSDLDPSICLSAISSQHTLLGTLLLLVTETPPLSRCRPFHCSCR